jgi:tryptophan 2,3-dioxygenase
MSSPEKKLTDYEKYIRTEELLSLQKPIEACANAEEPLFQTMHQAAELWMKQILFDVGRACRFMDEDKPWEASHLLGRCTMTWQLLARQIEITETMAPADYHVIRITSLGQGSGQQSPGFNRLLGVPPDMWASYSKIVARNKLTPMEIEQKPHEHHEMFRLTQGMMDYDEHFVKWRYTHIRLVARIIGMRVKSLTGVPATALEQGTKEHLFPELWECIPRLTDEYRPTY